MRNRQILVPVKLSGNSLDALLFARKMADEFPVCVTLLNVVALDIGPVGSRIYNEVCLEAANALRELATRHFGDSHAVRVSVRAGRPCQEIVAAAQSGPADLIILSSPKKSRWRGLFGDGTVREVVREAPCPTVVLPRHRKFTAQQYREALFAAGAAPRLLVSTGKIYEYDGMVGLCHCGAAGGGR